MLIGVLFATVCRATVEAPVVAVAANMARTAEELASAFTAATGARVRLSFGSSGNLTRQIEQGAPFEVFLSADESFPQRLYEAGLTRGPGAVYAIGRLALFTAHGAGIAADASLGERLAFITSRAHGRLVIANPDLAPYGLAARQVLESRGLWARIEPRLVLGENVGQVVQFILAGAADAAFIPYSQAIQPEVAARGSVLEVDAAEHGPLRQAMVIVRDASAAAVAFGDFVLAPPARAIIAAHGYAVPE